MRKVDPVMMVLVMMVVVATVAVATVETVTMTLDGASVVGVELVEDGERGQYMLKFGAIYWEPPNQWMASSG